MYELTFIPHKDYHEYPVEEMKQRSSDFLKLMRRRRTVREFSDRNIPQEIIEDCLLAEGTAPNGANMQPWHFGVVSDPELKKKIREEAEKEEHDFYHNRAPEE